MLTDDELRAFKQLIQIDLQRLPIQPWVTRLALWVECETGMRPQEIQALKYENLIQDEDHWVFRINDSYSEMTKQLNGHLKSRKLGESRLTPLISEQLYQTIQDFKVK